MIEICLEYLCFFRMLGISSIRRMYKDTLEKLSEIKEKRKKKKVQYRYLNTFRRKNPRSKIGEKINDERDFINNYRLAIYMTTALIKN